MKIKETTLKGVIIIEKDIFKDHRGFFMETYKQTQYEKAGICDQFVQDNISFSDKNTLRGLHYQSKHPQAKLVQAITGKIYDVAVDIRPSSPNFGKWIGVYLSGEQGNQLFIPKGFAHGFCVLSPEAHILYKCSEIYHPEDDRGILWSDPEIGIDWPVKNPNLSDKDKAHKCINKILPGELPREKG